RDPEKILEAAAQTLDFSQPVAVMLLGIMGHVTDDAEAYSIVRKLLAPLPSGSYLVLDDGTASPRRVEAQDSFSESGGVPYVSRWPAQIAQFFEGLDLVDPGVVSTPLWRPAAGTDPKVLDDYAGLDLRHVL
nr:SAM-dependent methyltransferase [Micromonospora sp. DSM 115978]